MKKNYLRYSAICQLAIMTEENENSGSYDSDLIKKKKKSKLFYHRRKWYRWILRLHFPNIKVFIHWHSGIINNPLRAPFSNSVTYFLIQWYFFFASIYTYDTNSKIYFWFTTIYLTISLLLNSGAASNYG